MNRQQQKTAILCIVSMLGAFAAEKASAQTDGVWTNEVGGDWSVPGNWADGSVATGMTGRAWFTNAIAADCCVNLDASPWTLNGLVLGSGGSYVFAVTNGTLNLDGATPTLTVNTDSVATVASVLSGSDLTKDGLGTLVLSGVNTYTGATVVAAGTLVVGTHMPSNTAALWHFDTADGLGSDASGNGNTLAVASGTPIYSADGKHGGALYLDGSSTLTTASFPSGAPTGGSAYTIALWEKDNGSGNNGGFVGWGYKSNNQCNNFRLNGDNSLENYWWGNDFIASGLSVNPKDGTWHHVAVTWDGANQTMYVDGVVVATATRTGLNVGATAFVVGKTIGDVNFKGWMDDLLIASRAFSGDEVRAAMNDGDRDANGRAIPSDTPLTIAADALLNMNGNSLTVENLSGAGTVDTTFAGGAPVLTVNETVDTVFAGTIKNTARTLSLVKRGPNALTLSSQYNAFWGSTTVWEGTLRLAETVGRSGTIVGPTVVMTNGVLFWANRNNIKDSALLTLYGGTADLQGCCEYFGGLTMRDNARMTGTSSGWFILNGAYPGDLKTGGTGDAGTIGVKLALASQYSSYAGNRIQTINVVTGTKLTVSGPIVNTGEGSNYVGTVRKTGGGMLVLSGTNTYSGGTMVNEGVVVVSNSAALGTGPVTLSGGVLSAAAGTWALPNAVNVTSNVAMNTEGTLTLFGAITNSGDLVKTGAGTLVLSGANTYSGATIISEGTLRLNSPMPAGTAAFWHFNDSANLGQDASTNGNDLVSGGGAPVYDSNGLYGGALYLNGGSTLTNAAGFPKAVPTGSTPYTIALWEKDNGSPANGGFVGWGTPTTSGKANNLRFNGSNALLNYWYGNDLNVSGLSVKDGNWHHLAVTWDGYNQKMYIDGTVVTNVTRTGLNVGTTSFIVGKTLNDVAFKGWMDDLLIANRAFSYAEILSTMANGYVDARARSLPSGTSVTIASGATLDLGSNSQTVAGLQGGGSVTGGVLTVTALLAPGGTNAVGTLTVSGDFVLGENAMINWNYGDDGAQDLVRVAGTLSLPSVATVEISRAAGASADLPNQAVLFSCSGAIEGSDLSGWQVICKRGLWRVKVSGNQVLAVRQTGTLFSLQ